MKNKCSVHTVEKSEIYSHRKKIRQINYLSFSLVNTLVSRIFGQNRVRVNFRNFHAVVWKNEKCLLTIFLVESTHYKVSKRVAFTKFLSKKCESKSPQCEIIKFSHCVLASLIFNFTKQQNLYSKHDLVMGI